MRSLGEFRPYINNRFQFTPYDKQLRRFFPFISAESLVLVLENQ